MKKFTIGDTLTGTAIDYNSNGLAVIKHDGFVVFVKNMMINETAEIKITYVKKNLAFGEVTKLVEASPSRVEPACEVYEKCGGCDLLHMDYKAQVQHKTDHVVNNFKKMNKQDVEVKEFYTSNQFTYRNKATYPIKYVGGTYVYGFYQAKTNDIIRHKACLNQDDEINKAIKDIVNLLNFQKNDFHLRHIMIRKVDQGIDVLFITKYENKKLDAFIEEKLSAYNNVSVNINTTTGNRIISGRIINIINNSNSTITIDGLKFMVSPNSFFQVNQYTTETLYKQAIKHIPDNSSILELYSGTGTISLLASRKAKDVTAIEIVRDAVKDAKNNALINHINNVTFVCEDASKYLEQNEKKFDVLVIDPPRKGLEKFAYEHIIKASPKKIIYISCGPDTLVRDIENLKEHYKLVNLELADMFPNTKHIESIAVLEKI